MFDQHIKMFDFKHNQEVLFLNDIKFLIFEEKKQFKFIKIKLFKEFY